ncbi:sulfatase-like hydrolase/transferase [Verrucomicrobiales bacterium]|nr:sulfatase-like hydrolase/transferase [Verrucomicrobiales bacterium]
MNTRIQTLIILLSGLFASAFGQEQSDSLTAEVKSRPHIVLVMSDDQGWGDVAYNGHPVLKTPNLDAAAASGFRFDSFYASAPSCSPTRASVLTGRHPNRMGVFSWGHSIRPQETTIAEVLRGNGYLTGHFGKWHLGSVRADSPVNPGKNGFDRWVSSPNFYDNNPVMSNEGREEKIRGESSAATVDIALEWIAEATKGESPIFAVIWFGSPHYPHRAAPEDKALYADQPKKNQDFLGEVTGIDRAFGQLRDGLEEFGIRDNTILWFTSDNGALKNVGSTGGYRGSKHKLYEGGLRVPAILEWPEKIAAPRSSSMRCCTTDIFPTLLDIVGVDYSGPDLDGISLVPLLKGEVEARPKDLGFWNANVPGHFTNPMGPVSKVLPTLENWSDKKVARVTKRVEKVPRQKFPLGVYPGQAAWISGDWKLHRSSSADSKKVKWKLFNLNSDPHEDVDVSSQHPELVEKMKVDLSNWLSSVSRSLNGEDY